jgi:hypothetical protein
MNKTKRISIACADRVAFQQQPGDQCFADIMAAADKAAKVMKSRGYRVDVVGKELVEVVHKRMSSYLDGLAETAIQSGGRLDDPAVFVGISDLEACVWKTTANLIRDEWRRCKREEAKVKAYTAEFGATECRSPERVLVWKDLLIKLLRRLDPAEIETLSHGIREGGGLNATQRQRLCRTRKRARAVLANLTGEAGDCLSYTARHRCGSPSRTLRQFSEYCFVAFALCGQFCSSLFMSTAAQHPATSAGNCRRTATDPAARPSCVTTRARSAPPSFDITPVDGFPTTCG